MGVTTAETKAAPELAGLSPPLRIEPGRPNSRLVALSDLTLTTCRWPIGDPHDEGFRFCGAPCVENYCTDHNRIAHRRAVQPCRDLNESDFVRPRGWSRQGT
jgi:hypothetical protein